MAGRWQMFSLAHIGINYKNDNKYVFELPNGDGFYWFVFFLTDVYIRQAGKEQLCKSGTAVLYAPSCPQYYCHPGAGFICDWMKFSGEDAAVFLEEIDFPVNTPFQVDTAEDIHGRIRRIEREFFMKDKNSVYMLDTLTRELLLYLSRLYNQKLAETQEYHGMELRFRQARSIIMSHLEKPWTIDDMASLLGLSPSHFSHLYTSIFHISPKQNLMNERMNQAKLLLQSQNYSIGEVAAKVGYDNIYHFSKQFKKVTGVSPTVYRKG